MARQRQAHGKRAGSASLRCDKCALGRHAHENARALFGEFSMRSHIDELGGAVRTLAEGPGLRADQAYPADANHDSLPLSRTGPTTTLYPCAAWRPSSCAGILARAENCPAHG